jgi:signal transduction histidine kinase
LEVAPVNAQPSTGVPGPGPGRPGNRADAFQQLADARLLPRLAAAQRGYQRHPWVRRWAVPVLCAAVSVDTVQTAAHNSGTGAAGVALLVAAFTVPLLWREQRPMLVFALVTAVAVMATARETLVNVGFLCELIALYNVASHGAPGRLALAVAVAVPQTIATVSVFAANGQLQHSIRTPALIFLIVFAMVATAALGLAGRMVRAYVAALRERAQHLEIERDQRSRLAAASERARVAREMHDILGHTLTVLVGLADGAAGINETSPGRGTETLRLIADSGRDALGELRRLLAVVDESSEDAPRGPQPDLTELDALVARVRAAGPTATLHTEGDLADLAKGLQLAVYRIVQEALTNALKHAGTTTTVAVTVTAEPSAVQITVEDTGPPHRTGPPSPPSDDGHGLVGMRERAALYGGSVTAQPNSSGGWTVRAHLVPGPHPRGVPPT